MLQMNQRALRERGCMADNGGPAIAARRAVPSPEEIRVLHNTLTRSLLVWLTLALAGCATFNAQSAWPLGGDADGEYEELMAIAETHAAVGETEAAVAAFQQAAAADGARKEPWLRIAHLRAANGEAELALIAAGEVLRRDPSDTSASDIYLASGLQIAIETLQRLRASDTDQQLHHRPQAQALLETLSQIYAMPEVLPDEVQQSLAQKAVEQWQRENPRQEAETVEPVASPLDILGGD